jgi:hypothetical protein
VTHWQGHGASDSTDHCPSLRVLVPLAYDRPKRCAVLARLGVAGTPTLVVGSSWPPRLDGLESDKKRGRGGHGFQGSSKHNHISRYTSTGRQLPARPPLAASSSAALALAVPARAVALVLVRGSKHTWLGIQRRKRRALPVRIAPVALRSAT